MENQTNLDGLVGDPSLRRLIQTIEGIRSLGKNNSVDLQATITELQPLVRELRIIIGNEITPLINRFKGDRIGDLATKKVCSRALMSLLDEIGCRIECPKTGQPASIVARAQHTLNGSFCLEVLDKVSATLTSATFPGGKIIPMTPNGKFHSRAR